MPRRRRAIVLRQNATAQFEELRSSASAFRFEEQSSFTLTDLRPCIVQFGVVLLSRADFSKHSDAGTGAFRCAGYSTGATLIESSPTLKHGSDMKKNISENLCFMAQTLPVIINLL